MQISPSTNLFRALGSLPQAQPASPARAIQRPEPEQGSQVAQRRQQPPRPEPMQLAAAIPPSQPAVNLPRGSLINLKV